MPGAIAPIARRQSAASVWPQTGRRVGRADVGDDEWRLFVQKLVAAFELDTADAASLGQDAAHAALQPQFSAGRRDNRNQGLCKARGPAHRVVRASGVRPIDQRVLSERGAIGRRTVVGPAGTQDGAKNSSDVAPSLRGYGHQVRFILDSAALGTHVAHASRPVASHYTADPGALQRRANLVLLR